MEHAGEFHIRFVAAVELVEFFPFVERLADFLRPVSAEVEQDDAVAVFDRSNRFSVFGDDESWQILVDNAAFVAVCLDSFSRRGELASFAMHVDIPSFLDHRPVGFVAVHRDLHTAAAAGDARVERVVVQIVHEVFDFIHIL